MGGEKKRDGERLDTLESGMKEMKEGQQRMQAQLDNMMEMLNKLLPQNVSLTIITNMMQQQQQTLIVIIISVSISVSMSASGDVLGSLKNQHLKEPEKELETDTTSGTSVLKKYLVACYALALPIRYDFHFYLTEDICTVGRNRLYRHPLVRVIRWGPPDFSRANPSQNQFLSYPTSLEISPNPFMNFLYSSKVDKNGVYAIGGLIDSDGCLPKEFARIPLAPSEVVTSSRVKVVEPQLLTSMTVGKAYPLIVEIGGSIFALSMHPTPPVGESWTTLETATFEVYDPKNRGWNTLPTPPFSGRQPSGYLSPSVKFLESFSHFAVDDKKLFVSDGLRSWSFDSESWKECDLESWKECDLFSECFPNMKLPIIEERDLHNKFQNGFPFSGEAILWKDGIYLCIIPSQTPSIAAFSISIDQEIGEEKAIRVELEFGEFDLFERGAEVIHLVDMGMITLLSIIMILMSIMVEDVPR